MPTAAIPIPAMTGMRNGFAAATPMPATVDDLALPIAVECKKTDACNVDHLPVIHL